MTLNLLSNSEINWECISCKGQPLHNTTKITLTDEFKTFNDCNICTKQVKTNRSINCALCKHWVHAKCIDSFRNNSYTLFHEFYKRRDWFCPKCLASELPFIELDQREFYITCLEMTYNTKLSTESVKNICHQLNSTSLLEKISFDSDSLVDDTNIEGDKLEPYRYFLGQDTCKYIFNLGDISWNSKSLSVLSFNIRSIRCKFKSLMSMLSALNGKIDVISISETWLGDNDNILDFQLENYHPPICCNRQIKNVKNCNIVGGGVITYIHKNITVYKANKSLSLNDKQNHFQVIDFEHNNKKCTFIHCYRSPQSDGDDFNKKLEPIVSKTKHRKCYIAGDFNFNLLNLAVHNKTEDYYNLLVSNSFKPIITIPTRITEHSQTIIDHIWTNDLSIEKVSGYVHITDLSDHLPCIAVFNVNDKCKGYKYIKSRHFTDENKENFRSRIYQTKEEQLSYCTDISITLQEKYARYFSHITSIYNECFPIKTKKVHEKTFKKPWITESVLKDMEKRNKAFSCKSKSEEAKVRYKNLKKKWSKS